MKHASATAMAFPFLFGLGAGGGLMYILDPDTGRRRRAHARDKAILSTRSLRTAAARTRRDVANRARGKVAALRSVARRAAIVNDDILTARVRSKIGRIVSASHAIRVSACCGDVALEGPILAKEARRLIAAAWAVPGVVNVTDMLERHEAADVPALAGCACQPETERFVVSAGPRWAPAMRLAAGAAGAALGSAGLARGGILGSIGGTLGGGLLLHALTDMAIIPKIGLAGRSGYEIHKSINIAAPVDGVFEFWRDVENFPLFMSHIRDVEDLGDGRSRWTVSGPGGVPVWWDAHIVRIEHGREIAWASEPRSIIENRGRVKFQPNDRGGTRVDVHLVYRPPAGALGHAVARLFRADPKHEMDQDLMEMKSLIESGRLPAKAKRMIR
jgi:uncharacterized membrane protein